MPVERLRDWFWVFTIRVCCLSFWNLMRNWHLTLLQRDATLLNNLRGMLKLFRGLEGQTQLICNPSQGRKTGLNHRKKLSFRGKWLPILFRGDHRCYRCLGSHSHKNCPYKNDRYYYILTRPAKRFPTPSEFNEDSGTRMATRKNFFS